MKKYRVEIDTHVKGQKDVDKLNDSLQETQKETENVNDGFGEMGGAADAALGGAVSKFQGFKSAIASSVKSLGILKVAVAATGLGLLLLTIASIKAAFTSTEEGQNKFAKLMNALGVITGNLIDLLADLGNTIIAAFENPQQALKDFWEALKQNVVVRINSVIDMFGLLGKAVKQVFQGDFTGAMESAKEAGSKYIDIMTGVEDTIGKATKAVTGFIEETKREIAISNELSDAQSKIDKDMRVQLVRRAKLEGEIADARLKALDNETFSLDERIALLEEAGTKTDEIFKGEVAIAKERLRQIQERNKLSGSTKEDLQAEAEAEANLIRLEKEKTNAKKETFAQAQSLRNQDAAEKDAEFQEDLERQKYYAEQLAIWKKKQEDDAQKAKEEAIAREKELWENLFATMDATGNQWLSTFTKGMQTAMDEIEKTGKLSTKGIMAVAGAALSSGAQLVNKIADQIDTTSREGFEKQKKLRLAGVVMDTFAAAIAGMLAGLSVGGPWGIALGAITAASALAFGAVQYANVNKTQFESASTPSGGSGSVPRVSTSAPSFSSITPLTSGEQTINDSINSPPDNIPTQAFVVSEQVESGSALDRNIKANASI